MTATIVGTHLDTENPWPGLDSFDETARAFFFGRDRETDSLLKSVLDAPVTVLYGRSGLGKTSLLRAGLFPLLRERHFLPIYVRFEIAPSGAPLTDQLRESVINTIRAEVPDALLPSDDETLWEYLHRNDFELWSARNYPLTVVIILDQFEELFTLGERVPERIEDFRNDLGDLAENRIPADLAARIDSDEAVAERFNLRSCNYKLLISLREDFLPELEGWRQLIPALGRTRMRLLPLQSNEAFDAVNRPAQTMMTEELAHRVVEIISGEDLQRAGTQADADDRGGTSDVEPALLSLFCRELNEERKRRHQPHFDAELVEDAKRDILSNYYASCVGDLPPRVARFIESQLITEKGFRNSFAREDAVPSMLTDDELDQLIGSRLVRLEERYGAQRIELTHDVLTGVVREHRDRQRAEDEKAALAARMDEDNRALVEAAAERAAELDREKRVGRRLRWLSAALAVVCVGAIVLAVVAVKANTTAHERLLDATAQRLYGDSQLMLAGLHAGSSDDVLGMQELLAALAIPSKYHDEKYPLLSALNQERDLLKVIDLPEVVSSVAMSPDGTRIASGSTDKTVRIWDAATGRLIGQPLRGHEGWVVKVAFSPDGTRIVSSALDGTFRLWDAATGQPIGQPMPGGIGVAFSPDGARILAGDGSGELQFWNTTTQRRVGPPLRAHDGTVMAVAFSPDGTRIASAGFDDKTARLWDAATGRLIGQPLRHDRGVSDVEFSPDGSLLASAGYDKTVRFWDGATGRPIGDPVRTSFSVLSVAFSPDGTRLATAGVDKSIRLWDVGTRRPVGVLDGHEAAVESLTFSHDGRRLLSGSDDKTVRVWDPRSWQPIIGHDDTVTDAQFSRDGRRILSGSYDKTERSWDLATGSPIGSPLRVADDSVDRLYPFGDDRLMSLNSEGTVIRLWDTRTGQPVADPVRLPPESPELRAIYWSDTSGRIAATLDPYTVQIWDTHTMRPIGAPIKSEQLITSLNLTGDGRILAIGDSTGGVRLRDASSGKPIGQPMTGDGIVVTLAASRDSRLIAAASVSGGSSPLRLWDMRTSQPIGNPIPVDTIVNVATFSPDGRILAAGSQDGTIRLWNVADQTSFGAPLIGHTGTVTSLTFSDDGTKLLSASDDHSLRVWPIPSVTPGALCDKMTHNMSREEWSTMVSPEIPYIAVCPGLPESDDAG